MFGVTTKIRQSKSQLESMFNYKVLFNCLVKLSQSTKLTISTQFNTEVTKILNLNGNLVPSFQKQMQGP